MTRLLVCSLAAIVACSLVAGSGRTEEKCKAKKNPFVGMVRHVVLFKYKDGTSEETAQKLEEGFRALQDKVPGVVAFECGTNCSPEGLSEGLDRCFLVTFKDAKARDGYLPHEAHQAFVAELKPHLDKVLVVDYVVRE